MLRADNFNEEMLRMSDGAEIQLAVYGSLAPGRVNHNQLASLNGRWVKGTVRGRLADRGWGAALGFHGLVLDPEADEIAVDLFISPDLPRHWARLDIFEGPGYRREKSLISTAEGKVEAFIYVLAD